MTLQDAFDRRLDPYCKSGPVGVAVSGGGDSVALLLLAVDWAKRTGVDLHVATVDHGLRTASAAEAADVAALCARLGVAHETLVWTGPKDAGNQQAAARSARYALLQDWAEPHAIDVILLGHTLDDQAETMLMNLARGSGVDGLAGMDHQIDGLFLRPILGHRRAELRDFLRVQGVAWVDDPSNDDPRFDRVKARQMMESLSDLGLTPDRLIQTTAHMRRARRSLWDHAVGFAQEHVRMDGPDLLLSPQAFQITQSDTQGRVLSAALQWIGATSYRPRYKALLAAVAAVTAGEIRTLGGVILAPHQSGARLLREVAATHDPVTTTGAETSAIWDGRWRLILAGRDVSQHNVTHLPENITIKAIGERLSEVPNWRETGFSRRSLMATPACFQGEKLVAAPVAGAANGWSAQFVADFHSWLAMH